MNPSQTQRFPVPHKKVSVDVKVKSVLSIINLPTLHCGLFSVLTKKSSQNISQFKIFTVSQCTGR